MKSLAKKEHFTEELLRIFYFQHIASGGQVEEGVMLNKKGVQSLLKTHFKDVNKGLIRSVVQLSRKYYSVG